MLASNAPTPIQYPFALTGTKNTIPETPPGGTNTGVASWQGGWGSINFTPIASGGIPPWGADFNAIMYAVTLLQQYQQAGFVYSYNTTFSGQISGYPAGAMVLSASAGGGMWLNLVDNNTTDPDSTSSANWLSVPSNGGVSTIAITGNYTPTLNQLGATLLVITGALTANAQLTLPLKAGLSYTVQNLTTGSFTLTVAGATGTGVQITQGASNLQQVTTDGTNYYTSSFNGSGVYLPIAGTAVAALKWATARTITYTGAATGSFSLDGSANASCALTLGAGVVGLSNLATLSANSLIGNATSSSATPTAITLTNGLLFTGSALGMGNITPTKVSATPTTAPTPTTAGGGAASLAYQAIGAFGGGYAFNDAGTGFYWGIYDTSGSLTFGNATTSTGALATALTLTSAGAMTLAGALTTTGVTSSGAISGTTITASGAITGSASIHITGNTIANSQGTWLGWNKGPTILGTTLNGEMDFINHHGSGSGGWAFYDTANGTSFTCNTAITINGNVYSTPTAASNTGGIATFAFVASGSFGGGLGLLDGTNAWGIYDTSGTLNFGSATGATGGLTVRASLTNTGAFTASSGNFTSSDKRLKKNIKRVDPKCFHRERLALTEYDWRDKQKGKGRGPIAQTIDNIEPQYIQHNYDGKGHMSVAIDKVAYEQSIWNGRELDKLAKLVAKQERTINALLKRLAKLER